MEWFARPLTALWGLLRQKSGGKITIQANHEKDLPSKLRKVPFYAHVPTGQIRAYQQYMDRAFALSPSLTFDLRDNRFNDLLKEATAHDGISGLDLEIMRMQYLFADPKRREKYRHEWAVKVVNREENDFFPSPWAIISALFSESRAYRFQQKEPHG
jgi:hypothetical protein